MPSPRVLELPPKRTMRSIRSFHLPREGALWLFASLVMFVTGLFKGINLLVLLAYLLIGLWVVNLRLVERDLRRLRGRRLPALPIEAGSPVKFGLEIQVRGSAQARGVTIEEPSPTGERRWLLLLLNENAPERIGYTQVFPQRGRHRIGPTYARSQFPFGLVGRLVHLTDAMECIVRPRRGRIEIERFRHWLDRNSRGDGRTRTRRQQPALLEAEIHGLREFRPGDSPRWIHWRSSARRNQLLVREFEENSPPNLTLIVETWLPYQPTTVERERLEVVISLAATICHDWCRDVQARLMLIVTGPEFVILPAGNGLEYAGRALELLAVAEGSPNRTANIPWPRLSEVTSLLILTSHADTTLTGEVAALIGRPPTVITAGNVLPWYGAPVWPEPEA